MEQRTYVPILHGIVHPPHLMFTQCGPDAGWRGTKFTHESYLEYLRAAGLCIPILFALVLGFRLECVMVDILHTMDQGISSHIVANVMWYFATIRNVFGGRNMEEKISNLNANLISWYRDTKAKVRVQGPLTVDRVRTSGEWPKLKCKAAATRHLASYVLHLVIVHGAKTVDDPWHGHDQLTLGVCQLLVRMYEIINSESMFLGAAAKTEVPKIGRQLAMMYQQLSIYAFGAGLRLWKFTPKLHLFLHLVEDQAPTFGNPRYWWCYGDEDLVGRLITVAEDLHPRTLTLCILFKWLITVFEM